MHWKITGWTCEIPAAAYSRVQINGTPTYTVWMLDSGTIKPNVLADYNWGVPTPWLFRAGTFALCNAVFERIQINATPGYGVLMMDAGRWRSDLYVVPWFMLLANEWHPFGQEGFWLRPNKFL